MNQETTLNNIFEFPDYFKFPPFFTIQPVKATRVKQLRLWKKLIIDWHRYYNISTLNIHNSKLFENTEIKRKLDLDGIKCVINFLIESNNAEWEDKNHLTCRIYWKLPSEWANELYNFIKDHGMVGNVYTIYELHSGEDVLGTAFEKLDPWIIRKAINILENEGKAQVIRGKTPQEDGVKFI